jgi:nitrile hydratase
MATRFSPGDQVTVRRAFPPGHIRTPYYARGGTGVVERVCGAFGNPEELAFGRSGEPKQMLYRVRFEQAALWPNYDGPPADTIDIELYEHWLEPATE